MSRILTPGLMLTEGALIKRQRDLPVVGELLVKVGDQVTAQQTVAAAKLPGELHILRIPEAMGLQIFEVLEGLQVKVGDTLTTGQTICEHAGLFGFFKSKFSSPLDGKLELINSSNGHLSVRSAAIPVTQNAYLSGTVTALVAGKSVIIEQRAAFIQGIFGVGGERIGKLHVLKVPLNSEIDSNVIPDNCSGLILAGGMAPTAAALKKAAAAGALGFITGSIDDRSLKEYLGYDIGLALTGDEEISMTVIITEGFGRLAFSQRIHALLSQLDGQEAAINGATQVRAGAIRPEIIIPLQNSSVATALPLAQGLVIGSRVRLIRVPYFGQYATVEELPHNSEVIATGASARVLRARLENGELITVPRTNVELI